MSGAAFLASFAALKSGCGLVYCAAPETERAIIAGMLPEAITIGLESENGRPSPGAAAGLERAASAFNFDLMVIGPGLSCEGGVMEFVFRTAENLGLPCVMDADALNCFAAAPGKLKLLKKTPSVMTPHEGEMKRLVGKTAGDRKEMALRLSGLTGGITVLKGPGTLITDGERILRNPTGGPALAKGGTGDVLAGLIGGLWAQKGKRSGFDLNSAFESAVLGVWLHGRAGELAGELMTDRCVLASELPAFFPRAFTEAGGGDA